MLPDCPKSATLIRTYKKKMKDTGCFSIYRQGASHKKAPEKPCQDHALHRVSDEFDIIALSDGHGSDKYFRSHYGAEIATAVMADTLETFCRDADFGMLLGDADFIQVGKAAEAGEAPNRLEHVMRHVCRHICSLWHRKIEEHWNASPLTPEETDFLKSTHSGGVSLYDYYFDTEGKPRLSHLPSAYGCTLFGVAETAGGFWVALHIGDGKCVAFDDDGNWSEPIPWDDDCFLNITTSMSSPGDTANLFRYCIGRKRPAAIFVASDGMDDSYTPMETLAFEYAMLFVSHLAFNGPEKTEPQIGGWLDEISTRYSRDDMSVAYIVWPGKLRNLLNGFTARLLPEVERKMEEAFLEVEELKKECLKIEMELDANSKDIDACDIRLKGVEAEGAMLVGELDSRRSRRKNGERHRHQFLQEVGDMIAEIGDKLSKAASDILGIRQQEAIGETDEEAQIEKELAEKKKACVETIRERVALREQGMKFMQILPVLKKKTSEARRRLDTIEHRLGRIRKVRHFLEARKD